MEIPQPQNEHKWLQRLVGSWTFEGECSMGPDQPPMKFAGTDVVESLGDLWTIGRLSGEVPGGGVSHSLMTLGYDPQRKRFVGTFVNSMASHLWTYDGALDHSGRTLILDCEGPSVTNPEQMTKYQDIIDFIDENRRTLRSQFIGQDGQWIPFMTSTYQRTAG